MVRVKVCGLMNQNDVNVCVSAGVHMLGFVVDYPMPVTWNLTASKARELIHQVPPFVSTCIVTGGTVEKVIDLVNKTCPDVVQLHYKETLQEVRELAHRLKLMGIKTIKALRIDGEGNCDFEINNPITATRELTKTGISAILVDSYTQAMPGGTGVTVDLSTFRDIQQESSLPVILAGGLNPTNILHLMRKTHPYAVDVLTGVEGRNGNKDQKKIYRFIQQIYAYNLSESESE